jgi:hypothetical protein
MNGLESIWKEGNVAKFEVLSQNFPGGTEENDEDITLIIT